jgi:hypothetical protein
VAVGYPGVKGAPGQEPKEEGKITGTVLGSDAVNSLVRQADGQVVIVDNKSGKRAGK